MWMCCDRFNFDSYVARSLPSPLRILLKTAMKQLVNLGMDIRPQQTEVRLAAQNRRKDVRDIVSLKCLPSCQHLVEHTPKRKDIAALISFTASGLFRRHIRGRADDGSAHASAHKRGGIR